MRTLLFLCLVACQSQKAAPAPVPVETIGAAPPPVVASAPPPPVVSVAPSASTTPTASLDITVKRSKEEIQRGQLQKQLDDMQMQMLQALSSQGSSKESVLRNENSGLDVASNLAGPGNTSGGDLRMGTGGGGGKNLSGISAGDTRDK